MAWVPVRPHGAPAGDGRASEGDDGAPHVLSFAACKAWASSCVMWSSEPSGRPVTLMSHLGKRGQVFQLKNEMPKVPPRIQTG